MAPATGPADQPIRTSSEANESVQESQLNRPEAFPGSPTSNPNGKALILLNISTYEYSRTSLPLSLLSFPFAFPGLSTSQRRLVQAGQVQSCAALSQPQVITVTSGRAEAVSPIGLQ